MATNVTFLRAFAADTATHDSEESYFFAHDRKEFDFANLMEPSEQIKMFHYTMGFRVMNNQSGGIEGVTYKGIIMAGSNSDFSDVIDNHGGDVETARYNVHVKPLIEGGGLIAEIINFNSCNTDYEITFGEAVEIYGELDINLDGIWVPYTMVIKTA